MTNLTSKTFGAANSEMPPVSGACNRLNLENSLYHRMCESARLTPESFRKTGCPRAYAKHGHGEGINGALTATHPKKALCPLPESPQVEPTWFSFQKNGYSSTSTSFPFIYSPGLKGIQLGGDRTPLRLFRILNSFGRISFQISHLHLTNSKLSREGTVCLTGAALSSPALPGHILAALCSFTRIPGWNELINSTGTSPGGEGRGTIRVIYICHVFHLYAPRTISSTGFIMSPGRRNSRDAGMMECWKNGILEEKHGAHRVPQACSIIPLFHYSRLQCITTPHYLSRNQVSTPTGSFPSPPFPAPSDRTALFSTNGGENGFKAGRTGAGAGTHHHPVTGRPRARVGERKGPDSLTFLKDSRHRKPGTAPFLFFFARLILFLRLFYKPRRYRETGQPASRNLPPITKRLT